MRLIDHLGSEVRTYREAKVEWTETSDSDAVLERTMMEGRDQRSEIRDQRPERDMESRRTGRGRIKYIANDEESAGHGLH